MDKYCDDIEKVIEECGSLEYVNENNILELKDEKISKKLSLIMMGSILDTKDSLNSKIETYIDHIYDCIDAMENIKLPEYFDIGYISSMIGYMVCLKNCLTIYNGVYSDIDSICDSCYSKFHNEKIKERYKSNHIYDLKYQLDILENDLKDSNPINKNEIEIYLRNKVWRYIDL